MVASDRECKYRTKYTNAVCASATEKISRLCQNGGRVNVEQIKMHTQTIKSSINDLRQFLSYQTGGASGPTGSNSDENNTTPTSGVPSSAQPPAPVQQTQDSKVTAVFCITSDDISNRQDITAVKLTNNIFSTKKEYFLHGTQENMKAVNNLFSNALIFPENAINIDSSLLTENPSMTTINTFRVAEGLANIVKQSLTKLKTSENTLTEKVKELEQQIDEKLDKILAISNDLTIKNQEIQNLTFMLKNTEANLTNLTKQQSKLYADAGVDGDQATVDAVTAKIKKMEEEIKKLNDEKNKLTSGKIELEINLKSCKEGIKTLGQAAVDAQETSSS